MVMLNLPTAGGLSCALWRHQRVKLWCARAGLICSRILHPSEDRLYTALISRDKAIEGNDLPSMILHELRGSRWAQKRE